MKAAPDPVRKAVATTPPLRPAYVWNGVTILKAFARRPRVLRLEVSQPRGSAVGDGA